MEVGTKVRVLEPFAAAFPDTYEVESVDTINGGTIVHLAGVESAFDPKYIEVAE